MTALHRRGMVVVVAADFSLPDRQPITLAPATAIIDIGGHLETKIGAFVEMLGLSKSYALPNKSHLLISSLNRRWQVDGVHLGSRGGGKWITATLVGR